MMNRISLRIKELVDVFGKRKNTILADRLGVNESVIRSYQNGMRQPKSDFLEHVVLTLNVDADWLLTGRGAMLPKKNESDVQKEHLEMMSRLIELVNERDEKIEALQKEIAELKSAN